MRLQDQLSDINNQAEGIIRQVMLKHKYKYVYCSEAAAFNEDDGELNELFVDAGCMLTIDTDYEPNEDYYFLGLEGNEIECNVLLINEQGETYTKQMLAMDDFTLCILADFLTSIKAN